MKRNTTQELTSEKAFFRVYESMVKAPVDEDVRAGLDVSAIDLHAALEPGIDRGDYRTVPAAPGKTDERGLVRIDVFQRTQQ